LINVLHIITELELGGAQKITLNILRNLNCAKFKTFLLSSSKGLLVKDAKELKNTQVFLTPFLKREINPFYDIIAFIVILKYIFKNNFTIVHTHSSKAGILGRWAAKLAGIPVIVHTYHGFGFNIKQKLLTRYFFVFLEKITAKITHKLIFVSTNNYQQAKSLNIGNKDNTTLIYAGIEKKKFLNNNINSSAIKKGLGIKKNEKAVGMIAPLKPQKAPLEYIEMANKILSKVSFVKFFLVGEGFMRTKAEELINSLGLNGNFILLGWRRDINKIIPIFDVVVLTSYWEGLPHVLIEAMFCEKPIVAYGVDGVCEIIKDGINGFMINPGDIESSSRRVLELLNNDNLSHRMGNAGYKMVKRRFSIAEVVSKTEQLYVNLTGLSR